MALCTVMKRDAGHGRRGYGCVMFWPTDGSGPLAIYRLLMTFEEGPAYGRTLFKMRNEAGIGVEVLPWMRGRRRS